MKTEKTISVQELHQPLLTIQSETEPGVTTDDGVKSPTDSPDIPPMQLKTPVNIRLKKGAKSRRGKQSPHQSRLFPCDLS